MDTLPFILHHEHSCISFSAISLMSFVSNLCKKSSLSGPDTLHTLIDSTLQRNGIGEKLIDLACHSFLVQDLISRMCLVKAGSAGSDFPVNQSYRSRSFTSSKLSVSCVCSAERGQWVSKKLVKMRSNSLIPLLHLHLSFCNSISLLFKAIRRLLSR